MESDINEGMKCPACGRYVGPVAACPYCGADLPVRSSMRIIRVTAILLATVGLLLLYLAAKNHQPRNIQIDNISPAMNFARVRVGGRVKRAPRISHDNKYLSFYLYQNNTRIKISVRGKVAEELVASGRLPQPGDSVEVMGEIKADSREPRLELDSADALSLQRSGEAKDGEDHQ